MQKAEQINLLESLDTRACVAACIKNIIKSKRQPSAQELVTELDLTIGIVARWDLESVMASLLEDKDLTATARGYLESMLMGEDLIPALRGNNAPDHETISTIDTLLQSSGKYRHSADFQEMIDFMGRFKDYAPYNNFLVRIQNPSCGFYATEKDWQKRFERSIKEDACPMLILAPMHPVLLVYDLDQTQGKNLPSELTQFALFEGQWNPRWLERLVENARRRQIRVNFKTLSLSHAGFVTLGNPNAGEKMRIVINADIPEPSQFGVLCHEMAHILLGHLGCDENHLWPYRSHLGRATIEIEAEATAHIVTRHLGLEGASAAYVSRYLNDKSEVPQGVSFDMIAKVAGQIKKMALRLIPPRLQSQ